MAEEAHRWGCRASVSFLCMLVFTGFPSPSCSTNAELAASVLPEPLPDVPAVEEAAPRAGSAAVLGSSSDTCNAGSVPLDG